MTGKTCSNCSKIVVNPEFEVPELVVGSGEQDTHVTFSMYFKCSKSETYC